MFLVGWFQGDTTNETVGWFQGTKESNHWLGSNPILTHTRLKAIGIPRWPKLKFLPEPKGPNSAARNFPRSRDEWNRERVKHGKPKERGKQKASPCCFGSWYLPVLCCKGNGETKRLTIFAPRTQDRAKGWDLRLVGSELSGSEAKKRSPQRSFL